MCGIFFLARKANSRAINYIYICFDKTTNAAELS